LAIEVEHQSLLLFWQEAKPTLVPKNLLTSYSRKEEQTFFVAGGAKKKGLDGETGKQIPRQSMWTKP
jgi:hypothetical protein